MVAQIVNKLGEFDIIPPSAAPCPAGSDPNKARTFFDHQLGLFHVIRCRQIPGGYAIDDGFRDLLNKKDAPTRLTRFRLQLTNGAPSKWAPVRALLNLVC